MKRSFLGLVAASFMLLNLAAPAPGHAAKKAPAKATASSSKGEKLTIGTKGDELAFDKTTLTAKPGQSISLTFKNNAGPTSGLQHNWVLVKPNTSDDVGQAGMTAGPDKGYVPDNANVVAHTKLVDPGKSDTITFTVPSQPGDYPYICTFPGHYMTMKGVLTVK